MSDNFLKVGKIVGLHGINGEVKISHFCDNAEVFFDIKRFFLKNIKEIRLRNFKLHKTNILAKIENIDTRTDAEKFLGEVIFSYKNEIPKDNNMYFIEDLKGLEVLNFETKENYGILKDVLKTSTCDVYSIFSGKKEFLVPILEGTVREIDMKSKMIFILPIKGIFDDEY